MDAQKALFRNPLAQDGLAANIADNVKRNAAQRRAERSHDHVEKQALAILIDIGSHNRVYGHAKQGAAFGYTKVLGYHPILATRADTGEVLHARMRTGSANTQRGAKRFVEPCGWCSKGSI